MNQPRNLAARAGRWSATHRKSAIFGWLLFVVLATVIGGSVGQKNLEASAMGNGESKRGELIVDKANYPDQVGEQVLVQGKNGIKGVTDIESPLNAADKASTVSKDGRSVVVNFKLPGKFDDTAGLEKAAEAPQDRVFEESLFWVQTRAVRCNYCMGHCEMLL